MATFIHGLQKRQFFHALRNISIYTTCSVTRLTQPNDQHAQQFSKEKALAKLKRSSTKQDSKLSVLFKMLVVRKRLSFPAVRIHFRILSVLCAFRVDGHIYIYYYKINVEIK